MLCKDQKIVLVLLGSIICSAPLAHAYLDSVFKQGKINPSLARIQNHPVTPTLNIRLDVGESQERESTRLSVNGLVIELQKQNNDETSKQKNLVTLPGSNGPQPHLSTGPLPLNVISTGTYVTLDGAKTIPFNTATAAYEMIWRDEAPAGMLICGFDLPECISKNHDHDVSLKNGRVYLSFPIWDKPGISFRRKTNSKIEQKAKEAKDEYDSELDKYSKTNNILKKALHFRNACAASEKYDFSGIRRMQQVPDHTELMELSTGICSIGKKEDGVKDDDGGKLELFLCTKGTVWRKNGSRFALGNKSHTLLGSALIVPAKKD